MGFSRINHQFGGIPQCRTPPNHPFSRHAFSRHGLTGLVPQLRCGLQGRIRPEEHGQHMIPKPCATLDGWNMLKPFKWDRPSINWCRISSMHSMKVSIHCTWKKCSGGFPTLSVSISILNIVHLAFIFFGIACFWYPNFGNPRYPQRFLTHGRPCVGEFHWMVDMENQHGMRFPPHC